MTDLSVLRMDSLLVLPIRSRLQAPNLAFFHKFCYSFVTRKNEDSGHDFVALNCTELFLVFDSMLSG